MTKNARPDYPIQDLLIRRWSPYGFADRDVAMGDLRENAEYKMARQEQDLLLAQKNELEVAINKARVSDFSDASVNTVSIGSVVDLDRISKNERVTYSVLGAWDGDPEKDILSYQTPLAKALLGKGKGDQVEIEIDGHEESWIVRDIKRWVDLH